MQLAGDLSKISLPSLVQLVRNGGLTGEITLSQGAKAASIFVEKGRVIHVTSDMGTGRDAFLELFLWLTGTFSFIESNVQEIPRSFPTDEPLDRILREGCNYLDQKKYLDQLRINGQTILRPTGSARQSSDLPLLDRLDGQRTLAQALSDANMSRRAYIQAVYRLLNDGLVVVETQSSEAADRVDLPGWVVARLKQDNPDLSQAIVDLVIWVDRVKCWMYQTDADLERIIEDMHVPNQELQEQQVEAAVAEKPGRGAKFSAASLASVEQDQGTNEEAKPNGKASGASTLAQPAAEPSGSPSVEF